MTPRLARVLLCVYPRWWRQRYGDEFEQLLIAESTGIRNAADVLRSALYERARVWAFPKEPQWSFSTVATRASAFLPIGMSLSALSAVAFHIALYGTAREADEGPVAHIWQLLMAGQLPILLFFALKWVPRAPKPAFFVLAAQVGAALASIAPVFFLGL